MFINEGIEVSNDIIYVIGNAKLSDVIKIRSKYGLSGGIVINSGCSLI